MSKENCVLKDTNGSASINSKKSLKKIENTNKNRRPVKARAPKDSDESCKNLKLGMCSENKSDRNTKGIKVVGMDTPNSPVKSTANSRVNSLPSHENMDDAKGQKKHAITLSKLQVPQRKESKIKMPLFSHLVQMERNSNLASSISICNTSIHPSFITFGLQCADGLIFCPKQRLVKLIHCLKIFIQDYVTPSSKEFSRDFNNKLTPSITFLKQCRPLSTGMRNAVAFLKSRLYESPSLTEAEHKEKLIKFLHDFLTERIWMAGDAISTIMNQKIVNNDVVLTYSFSDTVAKGLISCHKEGKKFKVIIVDSAPGFEGRKVLKLLLENDIKCSYVGLNGLSYVMKQATKIIIGANSLLSNGAVVGPAGSAMVTIVGYSRNVPVLVCCETVNFDEEAQTDSIVNNELGDPDDIINYDKKNSEFAEDVKKYTNTTLLNLYYDVIQANHVAAVITELGLIPCLSARAVLQAKN